MRVDLNSSKPNFHMKKSIIVFIHLRIFEVWMFVVYIYFIYSYTTCSFLSFTFMIWHLVISRASFHTSWLLEPSFGKKNKTWRWTDGTWRNGYVDPWGNSISISILWVYSVFMHTIKVENSNWRSPKIDSTLKTYTNLWLHMESCRQHWKRMKNLDPL